MSGVTSEEPTDEQSDILDEAALLVINAQHEAAAMLADAGMVRSNGDSPWFGTPCTGSFDGSPCPCSHFTGPGTVCQTRIAPPGVSIEDSTARCSHRAVIHLAS